MMQDAGERSSLRIALVGALDQNHAHAFSTVFNGEGEPSGRNDEFPAMPAEARITAAWDEDFSKTQALARKYQIEDACETLEAALARADAAIIVDDTEMTHHRWARPVMESGLPYFHDKPLAPSYEQACEIVEQATRYNAVMFSSSALPYARELEVVVPRLVEEGGSHLAVACGPVGRFVYYGIHPFSAVYAVFGPGVRSVQNTGPSGRHAARVEWESGKTGIFVVDERVKGFPLMFHTPRACHKVDVGDSRYYYRHLMVKFVEMALTGTIPVPWEHTLEIIKVLNAVEQLAQRRDTSVLVL